MRLDTHVLVWAMLAPKLLSDPARAALTDATERCVSAASLYEITCKAMPGTWPEVEGLLSVDLDARLRSDGSEVIPASGPIMERAGRLDRAHRDPFDRIIVATALERVLPVVSKDGTLDGAPGEGLQRVWSGRWEGNCKITERFGQVDYYVFRTITVSQWAGCTHVTPMLLR